MESSQTGLRDSSSSGALNIQAVADAAGVSKTTVSHVISGKRPVSVATRRRVEKVMDELGFEPNFFAQALQRNRSNTVALIVQDITNPFYPALARGLQSTVGAQNQVVMLFDAGAGDAITHAFIKDVIKRRVDGVVVAVSNVEQDLSKLINAGIAVVAVGSGLSELPIDWVSADDDRIAFDAVAHLAAAGHTRIGMIGGPAATEPAAGRLAGYYRAVDSFGLENDPRCIALGDWTTSGGFAAMNRLLELEARPSAVFCGNDLMAIGAMNAIISAGLRVPEDIALIGVDDIDAAALVRPALSTVRVPAQEIGRAAGDLLLRRLEEGDEPSRRHVLVQHTLISRNSI
ncbi:MAG TPA: LacI family DNA-binding transcriptional regulator [Galbitalea sp.]|jgi:DNA-binding LacI/PurR family transcriptional regulator